MKQEIANCFPCAKCGTTYSEESGAFENFVCEKCDSTPPITAYLYCETCETFCDYWKYDYNLVDAGHEGCKTRPVTQEEYRECLKECEQDGCFEEL